MIPSSDAHTYFTYTMAPLPRYFLSGHNNCEEETAITIILTLVITKRNGDRITLSVSQFVISSGVDSDPVCMLITFTVILFFLCFDSYHLEIQLRALLSGSIKYEFEKKSVFHTQEEVNISLLDKKEYFSLSTIQRKCK